MKKFGRCDHPVRKIAEGIYQINEFGIVFCYLIVGNDRALLLDAGTGFGEIKKVCEKLTDKPIVVAATHAHPDHIGGKGEFPEIYVHKKDCVRSMKLINSGFIRKLMYIGVPDKKKYNLSFGDIVKPRYRTRFIPMDDGHIFELGERRVTVTHTPGHSKGSVVFIDSKTDILFTGDSVCPVLWMFVPGCTSLREWYDSAKNIYNLSENRTVYFSHGENEQDGAQIRTTLELGKELLSKEHRRSYKIKAYPDFNSSNAILYIPAKVRGKRRERQN